LRLNAGVRNLASPGSSEVPEREDFATDNVSVAPDISRKERILRRTTFQ